MRSIVSCALGLAVSAVLAPAVHAQSIETISVSTDGKTVLVGGSNRTV